MAGMKSKDLRPDAFESPEKHAELRALLAAYERFLATNNRGDMALVYEEALKHTGLVSDPGRRTAGRSCPTRLDAAAAAADRCDARRAHRPARAEISRARVCRDA